MAWTGAIRTSRETWPRPVWSQSLAKRYVGSPRSTHGLCGLAPSAFRIDGVRGNYRLAIQSSCPLSSRVPLVRKLFCCELAANHLQCHCGLRWGGTKGRINARAGTSLTPRFQVLGLGTFAGAFLMLDAFLRRAVGFARRKPCRARRASRRLASRRRKYFRTNCPSRAASGPLQTRHAICGSTVSGPA